MLIIYHTDSLKITEELLIAAAGTWSDTGVDIMRMLWDWDRDKVHFTQNILRAALREQSYAVCSLMYDFEYGKSVTNETLAFAARYSTARYLSILLTAGCDSSSNGSRLTDDIEITPELVAAAAGNAKTGDEMISLLLTMFPEETQSAIGDQALLAAACSGQTAVLTMFQDKLGISPTDEHWGIAQLYQAVRNDDQPTV
ncbi:hypothetical protein BJX70DRAFT_394877 [Aspergillus crustosus]